VIRHPASDEEKVGILREGPQCVDLARDLRAAEHGGERPLRIEELRERGDLLLHQQARALERHSARHSDDRGVRAMRRAEGVIDVRVGETRQPAGELGVVAPLRRRGTSGSRGAALPRARAAGGFLGLRPHAVRDETDASPERLGERRGDRSERVLRVRLSLRLPEVGSAEDARPALEKVADRRERLADPRVVPDASLFERDVEIHPQKDAFAFDRQIPNGFHGAHLSADRMTS
jgi:hypothetical protein